MIAVGALMTAVVAAVDTAATDVLVFDGEPSKEAGWEAGTPNVGEFRSYAVILDLSAAPKSPGELDDEYERFWDLVVQVRTHGVSRVNAEGAADSVRAQISPLVNQTLGGCKVVGVVWRSLGGPVMDHGAGNPPMWTCTDQFILSARTT